MAKKNKTQDPYKMEMLDLWNEVGGVMKIDYYTVTMTITRELLQGLRDEGIKTDVMTCIMAGLLSAGKSKEEMWDYMVRAAANSAAPSMTFEAAEGEALNITGKKNNPMVDMMVQAVSNQQ